MGHRSVSASGMAARISAMRDCATRVRAGAPILQSDRLLIAEALALAAFRLEAVERERALHFQREGARA